MAAYPSEFELDVVLRDGEVVHVRPITPDDGDRLVRFFERLGPESRYYRFFRVKKNLDPDEVEYFTHVDYDRRMALIVLDGDEMVGVARFDRMDDDPRVAEVAFAVADDYQGRGIGTELLQLLTAYARLHGVDKFRAFVLPENVQMMRLFRNSGYELTRTLDDGIFEVDFPVAYTDDARAAAEEREKRAVAASILPLFFPRSIAVIGASNRPDSLGGRLFVNLLREGFTGPLYPVNPNSQVVNSVRAYPSVLDIPDPVDLAFVVVPAPAVLDVVTECADKGVRGVVVITAGFSETGPDGVEMERKLLDLVRSNGMRMVGPNCMGLVNTSPAVRMNGTFAPYYPPAGNVAMSSQSGALGVAILEYACNTGLGISQFISVGNKADVSGNDLLLAWEDDPQTDVILLYLESFGNPRKFARIARRIARKKPIAAVKAGRTGAGRRAASSHTGALASMDVAVDALFHQSGVIRTDTLEELFAVATLLANQPIPKGRRVGIITNSGGPGILAADALESRGLELPEPSPALQARLRQRLAEEASVRNPVDMIASGGPEHYRHVLAEMIASDEFDAVMVIYVPVSPGGGRQVAEAICDVCADDGHDVTVMAVFMESETGRDLLRTEHGAIPSFTFPERAAEALARVVRYGEWLRRDPGRVPAFDDIDPDRARTVVESALERMGDDGGWLEPDEVAAVLEAFGLRLPASEVARDPDEAAEIARQIGGPVVVKVVSASAVHKSDVGGVVLGVEGDEAVRRAFATVTAAVSDADGALIQEMVPGGQEVIVGMTEDPNFGPLVGFGLGGVFVEVLEDIAFRLTPLTDVDAAEMVRSIKGYRLLEGYRTTPPCDVDAAEEVLLRISAMAEELVEIEEMDLNPVKLLAPGEGARVVDARIKVRPVEPAWVPEIRDLPGVTNPRK